MRAERVVAPPPALDQHLGLEQGVEHLPGQELVVDDGKGARRIYHLYKVGPRISGVGEAKAVLSLPLEIHEPVSFP
jgi:hypothetical protein